MPLPSSPASAGLKLPSAVRQQRGSPPAGCSCGRRSYGGATGRRVTSATPWCSAKELLAEANLADGFELTIMASPLYPEFINIALVFGLLQFLSTFLIAWYYGKYMFKHVDPLARRDGEPGHVDVGREAD